MSANRGKYAEDRVKEFLEAWKQKHSGFTYNRILDAHSSKGMMTNPQPGDFQWFSMMGYTLALRRRAKPGESIIADTAAAKSQPLTEAWVNEEVPYTRNGLIEVKEVEHAFRLPYQNFGADQVGRMRIRAMAGSEPLVLTCHREKGSRGAVWRAVPLEVFEKRDGPKFGSWDLSNITGSDKLSTLLEGYLS